jgi:hypothetical protein
LVFASANDADSPAVHAPSYPRLNGPVGPGANPVAAKNGTGGWCASAWPSTVTTTRSASTSRASPPRWWRTNASASASTSSATLAVGVGDEGATPTANATATPLARTTVRATRRTTATTGLVARSLDSGVGGSRSLDSGVGGTRMLDAASDKNLRG